MKVLILFVVLHFISNFAHGDINAKKNSIEIYGPTYTNFNKYPNSAALIYENKESNLLGIGCSGVFLNTQWVLTAAHCIKNFKRWIKEHKVKIYVLNGGNGDLSEALFKFEALKFIENPLYKDAHDPGVKIVSHDYGLIKINFDKKQCGKSIAHRAACLKIKRSTSRIKIPSNTLRKKMLPAGTSLRMIGYGNDEDNWQPWHITYADLRTVPLRFVRKKYSDFLAANDFSQDEIDNYLKLEVHEKYIFTNDSNSAGCFGDSGAPLIIEKYGFQYLFAVHSWGIGNEKDCDGFGAHSSLSFDNGWINQTMRTN